MRGYALVRDERGHLDFDLRTRWSPRLHRAFTRSRADGLVLNYARGFIGHDLEFIRDLPLKRLNVLARTIRDLAPVYDLADSLTELRVEAGSTTRIDLTALPHLRALSCSWDQVADTIGQCTGLEDLFLGEYDPANLAPVAHLTDLRCLRMKGDPAVRSLDGVESMPWLAHLGIYSAPVEDTIALASLRSPVITELALAACQRITALTDLSGLSALRRLDLSEGGPVESLRPIADLQLLERLHLYGSTCVTDGDLSPVLGMRRVQDFRMKNRPHYAPSVHQVRKQLGIH
jgi:internalin A